MNAGGSGFKHVPFAAGQHRRFNHLPELVDPPRITTPGHVTQAHTCADQT